MQRLLGLGSNGQANTAAAEVVNKTCDLISHVKLGLTSAADGGIYMGGTGSSVKSNLGGRCEHRQPIQTAKQDSAVQTPAV